MLFESVGGSLLKYSLFSLHANQPANPFCSFLWLNEVSMTETERPLQRVPDHLNGLLIYVYVLVQICEHKFDFRCNMRIYYV